MSRIVPLTGSEAGRTTQAANVQTQEIHTTADQQRVFVQNRIVAPYWHGTLASQAAMLVLANRKSAITISAAASDNSFNDSGAGFPAWTGGDVLTVDGFVTNPVNNGAAFTVVSRTASKLVVSGATLITEAAGATITITKNGTPGCWPGDKCYRSDTLTMWLCISNNGELITDWMELPGKAYAQGAAVANVDQTGFPANGYIGGLTISAAYSQAEVQALRDECEKLRDTLAAAITTIDTLKGRFKVTGGNGLIAD